MAYAIFVGIGSLIFLIALVVHLIRLSPDS